VIMQRSGRHRHRAKTGSTVEHVTPVEWNRHKKSSPLALAVLACMQNMSWVSS
jgi:hypothetical protein